MHTDSLPREPRVKGKASSRKNNPWEHDRRLEVD